MDPNNNFNALSRYPLNYTPYRSQSSMLRSPFQSSSFQTPQHGNSRPLKTCGCKCTCTPASRQSGRPSLIPAKMTFPLVRGNGPSTSTRIKRINPLAPLLRPRSRRGHTQKGERFTRNWMTYSLSLTREDGHLRTSCFMLSDTRTITVKRFTAGKHTLIQSKSSLADIRIGHPQTSLVFGFTHQTAVLMRIQFLCIR